MLEQWTATARAAGATAGDDALAAAGTDLLARWGQPHRGYHDTTHLTETLAAVDVLTRHAVDLPAVRLAVWFHDAVYDGRPGQDEEASAVLARDVLAALGVARPRADAVARLVRVTAQHSPDDGDDDAAVLCDADLAILAAPAARYATYVAGVRREYAHVPDELFRPGRAAVLRALGASGSLFRTLTGRERWERAARANLAAELAELTR